jgi:hypothetical protein
MWRSKVPDELAGGAVLNEGNMYIWETTPPAVLALYRRQFQEDFSLFLRLRHRELVVGGQMLLAFLGRKNKDVLRGEVSYMWGYSRRLFSPSSKRSVLFCPLLLCNIIHQWKSILNSTELVHLYAWHHHHGRAVWRRRSWTPSTCRSTRRRWTR